MDSSSYHKTTPSAVGVILAAGIGSRLGVGRSKAMVAIGGTPMLCFSLAAFGQSSQIDKIVVVCPAKEVSEVLGLVVAENALTPIDVITGGETRRMSEIAALSYLEDEIRDGLIGKVAIHDAARPFVTTLLVDTLLDTTSSEVGAVPTLPTSNDIYLVRSNNRTLQEASASTVFVQTPQVFPALPLLEAYQTSPLPSDFKSRDTAGNFAQLTGMSIQTIPGESTNFKITFPSDLERAENILAGRALLADK